MSDQSWAIELEPYHGSRRLITIVSPRGVVARCGDTSTPGAMEDAQMIVKACNSHAALVAACEAVEDSPCYYDHHGYCQVHSLQPKGACYVELARAALAEARHE